MRDQSATIATPYPLIDKREVSRALLLSVWSIAGFVCWRRLSGGFTPQNSAIWSCLGGVGITLLALWAHRWHREVTATGDSDDLPSLGGQTAPFRFSLDGRWNLISLVIPAFLFGASIMPSGSIIAMTILTAWVMISVTAIHWYEEIEQIESSGFQQPTLLTLDGERMSVSPSYSSPSLANAESMSNGEPDLPPVSASLNPMVDHELTSDNHSRQLEEPRIHENPCEAEVTDADAADESSNRENVTLWLTRRVDEEGYDSLEGGTKVRFAPGQKLAVVHLGFFPSFTQTPEMECEVLEEGTFHIRPATVYPYGARLEIQRSGELHEGELIELGFLARSPLSVLSPAA